MQNSIEIFCSYAHEDEVLRQELEKHLQVLQRSGLIGFWHDRNINAGTEWKREIDRHLNAAHIILLLVSPDYINSDYCYSFELVEVMKRHDAGKARVIPIILRHVYWQETLFGKLQALPREGKPVTAWLDPNEAFLDIVENIRKILVEVSHSLSKRGIKDKIQWLEEGDAKYTQKRYHDALAAYEQATHLDPHDANTFCKQGLVLQRLGQTQLALAAYEQAIKYDKKCILAYIELGELYVSLGKYKQAKENFDTALLLDPDLAWVKIKRQNIPSVASNIYNDNSITSGGILLDERYQLLERIATGHIATIYRAWDCRLERIVALKELRQAYKTDPKAVERFSREATAAAIPHPHIVQTYDEIIGNDSYFIVMEYIIGPNLRQLLSQRKRPLQIKEAVTVAYHVALGLGAIHSKGMIHRDIKPQNIYFCQTQHQKEYITCKIGDFGIVSLYNGLHKNHITTTGMILGTLQYCSPEQLQGKPIKPSTDIYALGIVMYEMLVGRPPFIGEAGLDVASQHITDSPPLLRIFNTDIPASLEAIVMKCLEKLPENRFRDGLSLAQALEKWTDHFSKACSSEDSFENLANTNLRSDNIF